ncbi:MAG: hypothetical protein LLG04_04645, partial [Parachlamydia sp.]|nr:hypothetical protein [Parachlamydia sp.]
GARLTTGTIQRILAVLRDALPPENAAVFGAATPEQIRSAQQEAIEVLRTLASLLELMLKSKMRNISREHVQAPLLETLKRYRRHSDPKVAFLSEYNYYLLNLIKNNESSWHAFARYTGYLVLGFSKLAEVYSSKDITKIKDAFTGVNHSFKGFIKLFKEAAPTIISIAEKVVEKGGQAVKQVNKIETTIVLSEWPGLYFSLKQNLVDQMHQGLPMLLGLNALLKQSEKTWPQPSTPNEKSRFEKEKGAQTEAIDLLNSYPTHDPFFVSGLVELLSNLLKKCEEGEILITDEKKEGMRELAIMDILQRIFIDNLPGVEGKKWFKIETSIVSHFQNLIKIAGDEIQCGKTEGATNYQTLQIDIINALISASTRHPNLVVRHKADEFLDVCDQVVDSLRKAKLYDLELPRKGVKDCYIPRDPPTLSPSSLLGMALNSCPWRESVQMLRLEVVNDPILVEEEENYVPLKVITTDHTKALFEGYFHSFLYPTLKQGEVDRNKVLLITGQPGSGKTFTIRELMKQLWKDYQDGDYIPIIINLPQFKEIATAVSDYFQSRGLINNLSYFQKSRLIFIFESLDEVGILNKSLVELNQTLDVKGLWKFAIMCRNTMDEEQKKLLWPRAGKQGFCEVTLAPFDKYQKRAGWQKQLDSARAAGHPSPWEVENYDSYEEKAPTVKKITKTPLYHAKSTRTLPAIENKRMLEGGTITYSESEFTLALFCLTIYRELNAQRKSLSGDHFQKVNKREFVFRNMKIHELFDLYKKQGNEKDSKASLASDLSKDSHLRIPRIPLSDLNEVGAGIRRKWEQLPNKPFDETELNGRIKAVLGADDLEYFYNRCCPIAKRGQHLQYIHANFWLFIQGLREDPGKAEHVITILTEDPYKFDTTSKAH